MSGSHEKLPKFFWVQLVAAAFIGILWLFAPSEGGKAAEEAKADPAMVAALEPIGTVAMAQPVVEAGAPRSGEEITAKNCNVCHSIGLAGAPKVDDSGKADWEARLAGGYDAVVASAIKGKGGMPARGGDPSLTDDEISAAIKYMLSKAGVEVAEASEAKAPEAAAAPEETVKQVAVVEEVAKPAAVEKAAPVKAATVAAVVKPTEAVVKPVEAKPVPAALVATKLGEATYKSSCFACHDSGVANSPKFGDKAVWAPRIAMGIAALHAGAINGKGAMPGKGGNPSLSDQAVMEAVDYMIVNSQ